MTEHQDLIDIWSLNHRAIIDKYFKCKKSSAFTDSYGLTKKLAKRIIKLTRGRANRVAYRLLMIQESI